MMIMIMMIMMIMIIMKNDCDHDTQDYVDDDNGDDQGDNYIIYYDDDL